MNVKETYRKHAISKERRIFTNSLLTSMKRLIINKIEEGEVYCIKYFGHEFSTDKWHALSIVYVTEVVGNTIDGINLLYLNPSVTLNILANAQTVKGDLRSSPFYVQLSKEIVEFPMVCAKVKFFAKNILSSVKLKREDWGMVPLVEKGLFGNVNVNGLILDWKKETASAKKREKKKEKLLEKKEKMPYIELEDDEFGATAASLEESTRETLMSLKKEIMDDDI